MQGFLYIIITCFLTLSCTEGQKLIPKPVSKFQDSDSYNFSHRMRVEIKQGEKMLSNGLVIKGRVDRNLSSKDAYSKTISLNYYISDLDWGLR